MLIPNNTTIISIVPPILRSTLTGLCCSCALRLFPFPSASRHSLY